MEERFPTGIMCRGQVIIAVLEKETNIGKGAMIDGEHQWAGVTGWGGEARIVEFDEKGRVCGLMERGREEGGEGKKSEQQHMRASSQASLKCHTSSSLFSLFSLSSHQEDILTRSTGA